MQHFPTSHTLFHSILITILSFWCYYCCIFQDEEDEVYREVSEFSQDHPAGSVKSGIKVQTVWIQNLFSKPTSNALCDSLCLQKREKEISLHLYLIPLCSFHKFSLEYRVLLIQHFSQLLVSKMGKMWLQTHSKVYLLPPQKHGMVHIFFFIIITCFPSRLQLSLSQQHLHICVSLAGNENFEELMNTIYSPWGRYLTDF